MYIVIKKRIVETRTLRRDNRIIQIDMETETTDYINLGEIVESVLTDIIDKPQKQSDKKFYRHLIDKLTRELD
jgi:hypothetical protein